MVEEFKYKNKNVGKDENDKGSLKYLVNEKFKEIDNKNGITRDDKEILKAGRLVVNKLIKEIKDDKNMVRGEWALEPLLNLIGKKNGKGEYTSGLIYESNKLKGYNAFTNNKDKINEIAQTIDNAENETLKRLAKNRTTQNSRDIVKKGNENYKDKPMFVMEGGNDVKKQTGNIIFTEASNPVKIHEALKGLFKNPNVVYEIDYSGCDTSTPKGKAIKEKMTNLIGTQTCYLRYDNEQKTYTIRDKNGIGISDRAYIRQGVKLIPAGVRQWQSYVKENKEKENLGNIDNSKLNQLTKSMLKDIPSAGNLTPSEQKDLALKTENRITELLKKAKKLGYELDPECITRKWFGNGHMELHLNSGSSEVSRTIRGNDGDYNKVLGEKLDKFVNNNEGNYKTYLTKRVKAKWQELESLTKTETTNLNKKGQQNLTDKEKELAESHKQQVLYGIGLLEKMIDNYRESEGDSWDNDDRDLVQIKKLIRNAKASINDSNNLDDNAIINNFINPIWGKWASIKRITKNINNGQGQIYENPAYKEQYNQLKDVFLGERTKQISAIRSLGGHGRLFDKTETSFLAEEIEGNEDLTVKNADIKECIKNIKTRLPDSIFDKNGNIIQKRKEQFDKLFTAAAKGTDSLISLLVNSKMLPVNRKDEESEVRNCVENLKNQLNTIDKQSEIPNITESIKQKEKAEKLRLEQKSNKTEEEMQRLQALTFLEEHSEQRDTINKEIIERTRLEIRYLSLGDTVKSCLFPALAELGGGAEGKNSDIYNDIKGYGTWNLSDENAKKWSEEIIEDIIIEVAIAAVSIALAPTGAGEAIYLSFRVAKASAKGIKGLNKLRKSMGVFTKTFGKKMATQYAGKFSVRSAKVAKEITKVSHIATSTDKGIKGFNIVRRAKDAYKTIKATETFGSLAGKLALKGGSMIIEGVGFHLNSTVIHNAIEGKNLSDGINPFGYTEGPDGEKISNFRNYAQSVAFLGVLKTLSKPIQGLTGNMAKQILREKYDANTLAKMFKNIMSMTGEMGSMMGTDQILSLTFDQKIKSVTAEDLISMFGIVAGLRLTNKVYLKIQEYDKKSVTVEMKQGDNTFNVKIDREGNVIKIEGKDKDGKTLNNPQEVLGIKSGVEGQNLRETHNGKEVGTVKGNLRQLNNLHEGDIITVKHGENDVKFKKNKNGNREIVEAGKIENDRFKPGEEYIAKENKDGSGYHLETKTEGGPKISLDGKVRVKLGSSGLETDNKSQGYEEKPEEKTEDETKKAEEELKNIKERASKIRAKIREIEKQISEIENSREISNRKTVADDIFKRRTGQNTDGKISINKHYEGIILEKGIQIIDTRTGKKTTIKIDIQNRIKKLGGNAQELAKLDIDIAQKMILGIKNGHIEVENMDEAYDIKNKSKIKNLEIVGLENGKLGVRKKSNIRKLREQRAELKDQLKGLEREQRQKTIELNKMKKEQDSNNVEQEPKDDNVEQEVKKDNGEQESRGQDNREETEGEKGGREELNEVNNIEKNLEQLATEARTGNFENIKLDWITKAMFEGSVYFEGLSRFFKKSKTLPKKFIKKVRDNLIEMKNKCRNSLSEAKKKLVEKRNNFFENKLAEEGEEIEIKEEEIEQIEKDLPRRPKLNQNRKDQYNKEWLNHMASEGEVIDLYFREGKGPVEGEKWLKEKDGYRKVENGKTTDEVLTEDEMIVKMRNVRSVYKSETQISNERNNKTEEITDNDTPENIADKLENSMENNTNFEVSQNAFVSGRFIEGIKNWFNKIIQKPNISLPRNSIIRLKNKISEMMKNRGNKLNDVYKKFVERFERYLNNLLNQREERIEIKKQQKEQKRQENQRREREEELTDADIQILYMGIQQPELNMIRNLNKGKNEQIYLKEFGEPKNIITLGNGEDIYVSNCLIQGSRKYIVGYVKKGNELKVRLFYRSNSEGIWRACPGERPDGAFSKGEDIPNFSYETTTRVPNELQYKFDSLELESTNSNPITIEGVGYNALLPEMISEVEINKLFNGPKNSTARYMMGNNSIDVKNMYRNLGKGINLNEMKIIKGKGYTYKHEYLGTIEVQVGTLKRNGKDINIYFAHEKNDPQNRVRVEEVRYTDAQINSFGIYDKQINASPLTGKPIDYTQQVPTDMQGNQKIGTNYIDIRDLYQENPIIMKYKELYQQYRAAA